MSFRSVFYILFIPLQYACFLRAYAYRKDNMSEIFDLQRFLDAQEFLGTYERVLTELGNGRKRSHWIWFIFPQQKGLGHSYNSEYFGLEGTEEAKAFLEHPVLGKRLRECCNLLISQAGKKNIRDIMGSGIDVLKLKTSMTLFNSVSPNDIFADVLQSFF